MIVMDMSASVAAWKNACTIVSADSWMRIGVPVASGATANTAVAKRRIAALSLGLLSGRTSTRARPSAAIQSRRKSSGREPSVMRSGWRLERIRRAET